MRNSDKDCAAPLKGQKMAHGIYRIVDFKHIEAFTFWIRFDDGQEQTIDFMPVLKGALYRPLQDEAVFRQVEIDPERHTLVWPNGADFDPETLHDWPKYAEEMEAIAERWETADEQVV